MTPANGALSCERALGLLDAYIDNELLVETSLDVLQHIQTCPQCAQELSIRTSLKSRVRTAGLTVVASPELCLRVRQALRDSAKRRPSRYLLPILAVAAAAAG